MLVFGSLFFLSSWLVVSAASSPHPRQDTTNSRPSVSFSLAHDFSLTDTSDIHPGLGTRDGGPQIALKIANVAPAPTPTSIVLRARPTTVWRPKDAGALQRARLRSLQHEQSERVEWEQAEILGPDIEDRHTVGQLARMTGNAYALPGNKNWYDIDREWNTSFPFGWEDSADGFRGHVFVSPENDTVILSIKGTTLQGPTSKKDKFNDNLMFSCCCAYVDFSWVFSRVCDCHAKGWKCDSQCLSDALVEDSLFYNVGINLIHNITTMYPTSTIWLVGHSLGGALASLLGTTFGLPAVAFESPGERRAAHRLRLPLPPSEPSEPFSPHPDPFGAPLPASNAPVTHVYHTADPIPQGACTGIGSPCVAAGFALETKCHLGKSIVYDTVSKLGWKVDVRKHPIREVIIGVVERGWDLGQGWEVDEKGMMRDVPLARAEDDCVDCFKWEFGEFKKRPDDKISLGIP